MFWPHNASKDLIIGTVRPGSSEKTVCSFCCHHLTARRRHLSWTRFKTALRYYETCPNKQKRMYRFQSHGIGMVMVVIKWKKWQRTEDSFNFGQSTLVGSKN